MHARPVTAVLDTVEACVDALITQVGKDIRIGLPLGLGKPVELINALYQRAQADATLQLTILTALSLEKPVPGSALEQAFLQPFLERVFGDSPELLYMLDLRANQLPANVIVKEFFFKPGSNMTCAHAQQHYISSNYTFAARDVYNQGCNVAAQVVCKRDTDGERRYSLSCNPDTSLELIALLRAAEARGERRVAVVGQVNQKLPFMAHDAEVGTELFDLIVDHPRYNSTLFSTPKTAVATPDYAIGLYTSALIKDGGTLQVGIGALGDAVIYATLLRHSQPVAYREALTAFGALDRDGALIAAHGGTGPFEQGLYGASEMFVDGFMHLYQAGILKRKVYDFWALQQLINEGRCNPEKLTPAVLDALASLGLSLISQQDFERLQQHGFFNANSRYEHGDLIAANGQRVVANLADLQARQFMAEHCLGSQLVNGIVLHGGFFLGPNAFYDALHAMSEAQRREICMTGVYKVNQLDHSPLLYQAQRLHARFINTGIMVTLNGAVMSDGLEDGRVISGVGGQYNFVAMAHQLPTGRSILLIRAVRDKQGKTAAPSSNVVFNYGNITIPRHLRDLVVTEYGIADLRSKSDNEIAKALLNIADSRFQQGLLAQIKASGKVEASYEIPERYCHNTPMQLEQNITAFKQRGLFGAYPLGTDFTAEELVLLKALKTVKAKAAQTPKWKLALQAWRFDAARDIPSAVQPYLLRLKLTNPQTLQDKVARMLLVKALT